MANYKRYGDIVLTFGSSSSSSSSLIPSFSDSLVVYGYPPLVDIEVYDFLEAEDGDYVIVGTGYDNDTDNNSTTVIKFNLDTGITWQEQYPLSDWEYTGGYGGYPAYIIEVSDGFVILTKEIDPINWTIIDFVLKISKINGDVIWGKQLRWSESGDTYPTAIHQTADGGYFYISSQYVDATGGDAETETPCIFKLTSLGEVSWSKWINTEWAKFSDAKITADNGYIVGIADWTAEVPEMTLPYAFEPIIIKFDSSGTKEWARKITRGFTEHSDNVVNIIQTTEGGYLIYLTGYNYYSNNVYTTDHLCIMKITSTGNISWVKEFPENTTIQFDADAIKGGLIELDDGYVFSCLDMFYNPVIIKISLTGDFIWAKSLEFSSFGRTTITSPVLKRTSGGLSIGYNITDYGNQLIHFILATIDTDGTTTDCPYFHNQIYPANTITSFTSTVDNTPIIDGYNVMITPTVLKWHNTGTFRYLCPALYRPNCSHAFNGTGLGLDLTFWYDSEEWDRLNGRAVIKQTQPLPDWQTFGDIEPMYQFNGPFDVIIEWNLVNITGNTGPEVQNAPSGGWFNFFPTYTDGYMGLWWGNQQGDAGAEPLNLNGVQYWKYAYDDDTYQYFSTTDFIGKFRITRDINGNVRGYYFNRTLWRWEWNGDPAGTLLDVGNTYPTSMFLETMVTETRGPEYTSVLTIDNYGVVSGCDDVTWLNLDAPCCEYYMVDDGGTIPTNVIVDSGSFGWGADVSILNNRLRFVAVPGPGAGYQYEYNTTFSFLGGFMIYLSFIVTNVDPANNNGWIYLYAGLENLGFSVSFEWTYGDTNPYYLAGSEWYYTTDREGLLIITRASTSNEIKAYVWEGTHWAWNGDSNGLVLGTYDGILTPTFEIFSGFDEPIIEIEEFVTVAGCQNIQPYPGVL